MERSATEGDLLRALLARLPPAVAATSEPDFHSVLAAQLAPVLGCERWLVVRYTLDRAPRFLCNRALGAAAARYYEQGLYRIDVLYRLWREQRSSGVHVISREGNQAADRRYLQALQRTAAIADELALLLPQQQGECIAVCWDRDAGEFGQGELDAMLALAPTLLELHHLHAARIGPLQPPDEAQAAPPLALSELLAGLPHSAELTAREQRIIQLITRGYPNTLIADKLVITVGTVKNHRSSIYYKLDITSERELLALLLRQAARS
jgi:DNA-binding CsgD family transcriptional regulator